MEGLHRGLANIEVGFQKESDDLKEEAMKPIFLSNNIVTWTGLEVSQCLKPSGHRDTLPEASNLLDEIYRRGEIQSEQYNSRALDNLYSLRIELPSKLLKQIASNKRPKKEENMLIVMDKSTGEEMLSQPIQPKQKQFIIEVTFLTGYTGTFNDTSKKALCHIDY